MHQYVIVIDVAPADVVNENRQVVGPFDDLDAAYAHRYRHFADRRAVVARLIRPIPDND